jgi:hypothetical protein
MSSVLKARLETAAQLGYAAMPIDQKVSPVESAEAREAREQAEWAENERRWRDPSAEPWCTRLW